MHIFPWRSRKGDDPKRKAPDRPSVAEPPAPSKPLDAAMRNQLRAVATEVADAAAAARREHLEDDPSGAMATWVLAAEPGLSVRELSERIGLSHSATVRVADRMEESGLLERGRGRDDARKVVLSLSPLGLARMDRSAARADESIDALLQDLTSGERVLLGRILNKVARRLPNEDGEGARVCRNCAPGPCGANGCPREAGR